MNMKCCPTSFYHRKPTERKRFPFLRLNFAAYLIPMFLSLTTPASCGTRSDQGESMKVQIEPEDAMPAPATQLALGLEWRKKVSQITWAAYSPPAANPKEGIEATNETVQEDLDVLRKAGFYR
jgi:hypothetical protein